MKKTFGIPEKDLYLQRLRIKAILKRFHFLFQFQLVNYQSKQLLLSKLYVCITSFN